jgi:hypothetical protein
MRSILSVALAATAVGSAAAAPLEDDAPQAVALSETADTDADAPATESTEPAETAPALERIPSSAKLIAALESPRASEEPAQPQIDTGVVVVARTPRATPRFLVSAGVFLQSRGMEFDYDADADGGPPSYPDSGLQGFAAAVAVYPLPIEKYDGKPSGVGFAAKIAKSVGATLVAGDDTGTGEYVIDHSAYDFAVRYRYPIDRFAVAGEVSYGNWSHSVIDLPESIAIPDTSYSYLAAGAHVDIYPSERACIGFGARYLHLTSSGDVMGEDWYGAGEGSGFEIDGDVVIPLPRNLFVRGGVEYRKITVDFDGTGELSWYWGVGTMRDASITGSASLGVEL